MMDYLVSDLPFYHSIQKTGQNIRNNYLQTLDYRPYCTMVQERRETNDENSMIGLLSRPQHREGKPKQSTAVLLSRRDRDWNLGKLKHLEFAGRSTSIPHSIALYCALQILHFFFFLQTEGLCNPPLSDNGQYFSAIRYFFFNFFYLWLCWVFVAALGLSLVAASGGHSSSWCAGLSLSRPLLLQSTGSRRADSVIVAHGLSRSAACGIFPDQGSNPCPLHWQADSQPLRHQGSPTIRYF